MRYVGIDPSTKTGMVIIDGNEIVLGEEVKTKETQDPYRFIEIAEMIVRRLVHHSVSYTDNICIEGFSYGSKGAGVSTQYGIGWLIRAELIRNGYTYHEVAPGALKKFATGKGNTKKDEMVLPIYKKWGFEHSSDNVRDAYVLARIAKALHDQEGLTEYQKEVMKKVV
jgi:crossover junction endodeoxyribonuclease RuvC